MTLAAAILQNEQDNTKRRAVDVASAISTHTYVDTTGFSIETSAKSDETKGKQVYSNDMDNSTSILMMNNVMLEKMLLMLMLMLAMTMA